jgi:hypothetical protein
MGRGRSATVRGGKKLGASFFLFTIMFRVLFFIVSSSHTASTIEHKTIFKINIIKKYTREMEQGKEVESRMSVMQFKTSSNTSSFFFSFLSSLGTLI